MLSISIIITTYNRLPALQAVIESLRHQHYPNKLEILVADDGSTQETGEWLKTLYPLDLELMGRRRHDESPEHIHSYVRTTNRVENNPRSPKPMDIQHVWHPDDGFKAAQIRNRAAAKASGDYLIFLDGDCITPIHFIQHHAALAEQNYFVSGNRILLSAEFTEQVLQQNITVYQWGYLHWLLGSLQKKCNRALPFLPLPSILCARKNNKWQGAKTCNLAIWKKDFLAVNGFDERYQGWGYEDSDLVIRLMRAGIARKNARFSVPVIHLWHPENDRSQEQNNQTFLQEILSSNRIFAEHGVNQYL